MKYCRREKVAERVIAGESFLIPICGTPVEMGNIFVLNPLGEFIWRRLDGGRTVEAVVAEIVDEFDVSVEQAGQDAAEFIGRLVEHGLVEERA